MRKAVLLLVVAIVCFGVAGCVQQQLMSHRSTQSLFHDPSRQLEERITTDSFTGDTIFRYYPGRGMFETKIRATLYKSEKHKTLITELYYISSGWLFINSVYLKVDSEPPIQLISGGFKRNVISGDMISESYDGKIDIKLLNKIANAATATLRFSGDRGTEDYTISDTEKQGLRWILSKYEE